MRRTMSFWNLVPSSQSRCGPNWLQHMAIYRSRRHVLWHHRCAHTWRCVYVTKSRRLFCCLNSCNMCLSMSLSSLLVAIYFCCRCCHLFGGYCSSCIFQLMVVVALVASLATAVRVLAVVFVTFWRGTAVSNGDSCSSGCNTHSTKWQKRNGLDAFVYTQVTISQM